MPISRRTYPMGCGLACMLMLISVNGCQDNKLPSLPVARYVIAVTTPKEATKKELAFAAAMEIVLRAPLKSEIIIFDGALGKTIFAKSVGDKKSMSIPDFRLDAWQNDIKNFRDRISRDSGSRSAHFLNIPKA